jgi:hypothetical protein
LGVDRFGKAFNVTLHRAGSGTRFKTGWGE